MNKIFYEHELDGKKIVLYQDAIIKVQIGKYRGAYKTQYTFPANNFAAAVHWYNGINISYGYKKRLYCETLNKPVLAVQRSF